MQMSAGGSFTVLLRSDGRAVAGGRNYDNLGGRAAGRVPALESEVTYAQVSAGEEHTFLSEAMVALWHAEQILRASATSQPWKMERLTRKCQLVGITPFCSEAMAAL